MFKAFLLVVGFVLTHWLISKHVPERWKFWARIATLPAAAVILARILT